MSAFGQRAFDYSGIGASGTSARPAIRRSVLWGQQPARARLAVVDADTVIGPELHQADDDVPCQTVSIAGPCDTSRRLCLGFGCVTARLECPGVADYRAALSDIPAVDTRIIKFVFEVTIAHIQRFSIPKATIEHYGRIHGRFGITGNHNIESPRQEPLFAEIGIEPCTDEPVRPIHANAGGCHRQWRAGQATYTDILILVAQAAIHFPILMESIPRPKLDQPDVDLDRHNSTGGNRRW